MDVQVRDHVIYLVPQKLIPKDQRWFWTKEWQEMEREADEAIEKGKVLGPFTDIKDALEALKLAFENKQRIYQFIA